jgi:PAS domain S-box-containing protein/putative nucleotidyltransferase with HDIG domain
LEKKIVGENASIPVDSPISTEGIDLSFFDTIPAALLSIDEKGRILKCNPAGKELFGAGSTDILKDFPLMEYLSGHGMALSENQVSLPVTQKITLHARIRRLDGQEVLVRAVLAPAGGGTSETLVFLVDLNGSESSEESTLLRAYQDQKNLNRKLGEILELSRTFSLYLNLERVMNQIARVVSESLGYGMVGLYLKDEKTDRMRVATYLDTSIDITSIEMPNPGMDFDLLKRITGNSSDLKMIGGKRLRVNFGDGTFGEGEDTVRSGISGNSEVWQLDEYLLALVRLEGSVMNGFIRVSKPLRKPRTGSLIKNLPLESDVFCQQALWIFASQAAVAVENAILFEKAQMEINDRKQAETELAAAQEDLKKRIHTRTLRLEKANQDLLEEIQKRKLTQGELDGQKEFLRQVLDTNPTLIYVRDRMGRYTLVNEAVARFEGLTVDDFAGKMVNDLKHDISQVIRWRHEDLDVLDNHREMIHTEERVMDTYGGEHYFQTIKRPIISSSGQADLVLGVSVDITALKRAEERAIQANIELARAYDATIEGWSRALDFRDHETEGHSRRVANMTLRLANALGIDPSEHQALRRGALLHDIGKMGIPDDILRKQGPLSPSEWEVMRSHPVIAYEMLNPIDYLSQSLVIPHYHHEKWNGKGYPEGLEGEMIPLAARIFAVVDVWDALSNDRPHRKAWEKDNVINYIKTNSSTHFDPKIVNVFIQNLEDIIGLN